MLPRENFRRCKQRRLLAVSGGAVGCGRRDHGLAAADVALHQAAHGPPRAEIRKDLLYGARLRPGEPEGQRREKGRQIRVGIGRNGNDRSPRTHQAERRKENIKLLKNQPPPRGLQRLVRRGAVDLPQRLGLAAQPVLRPQCLRKRFGQGQARLRGLRRLDDHLVCQPGRQRIHRQNAARQKPRRVHRLKERVRHGIAQVIAAQRAVKAIAVAPAQLLGQIALIEEGQIQAGRVVRDGDLHQLQAAAAGLGDAVALRIGNYGGNKARRRPLLQLRDVHEPRAVLIGAGVKAQKLLERLHAYPGKQLRPLRADARQAAYGLLSVRHGHRLLFLSL